MTRDIEEMCRYRARKKVHKSLRAYTRGDCSSEIDGPNVESNIADVTPGRASQLCGLREGRWDGLNGDRLFAMGDTTAEGR